MGQDCERTLALAIKSIKEECSHVYFMDGGSTDKSIEIAKELGAKVWQNKWDPMQPNMAGIHKKLMFDQAKKLHPGEWCVYLDADEMIEEFGLKRFKKFIEDTPEEELLNVYSVRMRHLIYNFIHEDNTKEDHSTHGRFFKLIDDVTIPPGNHVFFIDTKNKYFQTNNIIFWHLA